MHIQQRYLKALPAQLVKRVQHRMVLKFCGDEVFFPLARTIHCDRDDCLIVSLASAGGEHDLPRVGCADQPRDLGAAGQQMLRRLLTERVEGAGVSIYLIKVRKHGFLCSGG